LTAHPPGCWILDAGSSTNPGTTIFIFVFIFVFVLFVIGLPFASNA
jgi:hypothetical protein